MGCLAGVVSDETDCVREGAVLGFGSQVEDWEAMGGVEKGVEAVRRRGEGQTGGNSGQRGVDMDKGFVCEVGELHIDAWLVVVALLYMCAVL